MRKIFNLKAPDRVMVVRIRAQDFSLRVFGVSKGQDRFVILGPEGENIVLSQGDSVNEHWIMNQSSPHISGPNRSVVRGVNLNMANIKVTSIQGTSVRVEGSNVEVGDASQLRIYVFTSADTIAIELGMGISTQSNDFLSIEETIKEIAMRLVYLEDEMKAKAKRKLEDAELYYRGKLVEAEGYRREAEVYEREALQYEQMALGEPDKKSKWQIKATNARQKAINKRNKASEKVNRGLEKIEEAKLKELMLLESIPQVRESLESKRRELEVVVELLKAG